MYDQLYRESRQRVTDLLTALDAAELDLPTPACPGWTVRDVLAHLVGAAAAFAHGDLDGAGSPQWTARHIEARRGRSVSELVAEWESDAPVLEAIAVESPSWLPILHDALSHEADIRAALDAPRLPADALAAAFGLVEARVPGRLAGLGGVHIDLEGRVITSGDGQAALQAETELFEFWRGWFGRRSPAQLRSWVTTGDAAAFAAALPVFDVRDTDLVEPV